MRRDLEGSLRKLLRDCCVGRSAGVSYEILKALPQSTIDIWDVRGGLTTLLSQARSSLKSEIFSSTLQRPLKERIQYLRKSHPVLDELLHSTFFTHFDIESWALGWNAKNDNRGRVVGNLVGWGLVAKRIDTLIADLMDEPEPCHLLKVCDILESITSKTPWWSGLDFASNDRPSPPSTPEPKAKARTKAKGKASHAGNPDVINSGHPVATARAASPGPDRWSQSDRGKRSESRQHTPDQDQTRRNPTRAAKTASQQSERTATASQHQARSQHSRTKTTRAGQPRKLSQPALPPSPPSAEPPAVSPSPPSAGSNDASPRIPRPNTPVQSPPSQSEAPVDASESGDSDYQGNGASRLATGHSTWSFAHRRNLPQAMIPPVLATKTYDYYLGAALYDLLSTPETLRPVLERNKERMAGVIWRLNQERQNLRESLVAAARQCLKAPYGGCYAQSGLATTCSIYKV